MALMSSGVYEEMSPEEEDILAASARQEKTNRFSFDQAVQKGEANVAAFFAGGKLAAARVQRVGAHGSCKEESLRTVRGQQDIIMQLYAH
jgi:hypothetical protein